MVSCSCSGNVLVYSCSGAADVGHLSDMVARQLSRSGFAGMSCLASVGAQVPSFVESAKKAEVIFTIDGCALQCAKRVLGHIDVKPTSYILTDMGFIKGKTKPTDSIAQKLAEEIMQTNKKNCENTENKIKCSCCG